MKPEDSFLDKFAVRLSKQQSTNSIQFKSDEPELLELHDNALDIILAYHKRTCLSKRAQLNDSLRLQMSLIAIFLQGSLDVRNTILNGNFFIAAALLKQELELLSQIKNLQRGKFRKGKVARIKEVLPSLSEMLREMNHAAHPSQDDIFSALSVSELSGNYVITPPYRRAMTRSMITNQIVILLNFLAGFREIVVSIYNEDLSTSEFTKTKSVLNYLIERKLVKIEVPE